MTLTRTRTRTSWEAVIGLEVHAQLLTRSKMFCGCPAEYVQGEPNTRVCPVCLGMPGVLPVINRQAVEFVMMTGLALNCTIASYTQFDRKNYPYPDLMKGYQISQFDNPIASDGWLDLDVDGQRRRVGVTRVHLEEDVAKLQHVRDGSGEAYSLVDVNRAGVPLMETVSEPDMRSPEEARQYLLAFHSILQYLGVSTADMEKGAFRCDANVSVRPMGSTELSSKVEVKNMNSFRSVFHALEYEVERQVAVLEDGGRVVQETRGWSERPCRHGLPAHQGVRSRLPLLSGAGPAPPDHLSCVGRGGAGPSAAAPRGAARPFHGRVRPLPLRRLTSDGLPGHGGLLRGSACRRRPGR